MNNKKQNLPEIPFTVPQISSASKNDWFVFFRFFHTGKWHLRKFREGINRHKDLEERKLQAEALCEARHMWLKTGWNPITDPDFKLRNVLTKAEVSEMYFNEALDFALSKKKLATKSKQDYSNMIKHIQNVAIKTGFSAIQVSKFETFHVLELMDKIMDLRSLSNNSYNKYLDCLRSMFSVLKKRQIIKYNPASELERLKVAESNKYVSLEESEKEAVTKELFTKHYTFYVFIQVLYHTGIRPKEILSLKISDIDLNKQLITVVPDLKEENSKTTKVRHVAIADQLLPFLNSLELDNYPCNYYVFGSPFGPGGNRGSVPRFGKPIRGTGFKTGISGAMRQDYFRPSPNHIKRDTVTKLWKKIVIDGLNINKHLYALKHTGADDKILAGIELDALRELYGHTSKLMTETYAKKIKEVNRKQIIKKAPAFSHYPLRKVS